MAKKKSDAPAEVETITLTMSRPVAEAVQAACEWYLRLHMGQFWDLAEGLCFAKFYSDAENNAFQSEEQRKNAFNVAIGRRNTMLLEMERLYSRCVLHAPISDVMRVPYRAEQVWLAIRHALAWHDKPEGDRMNVAFDKPLNRSDQPQPIIKLNLIPAGREADRRRKAQQEQEKWKINNGDFIRSMTDEDITENLTPGICDLIKHRDPERCQNRGRCFRCIKDWLKEENTILVRADQWKA